MWEYRLAERLGQSVRWVQGLDEDERRGWMILGMMDAGQTPPLTHEDAIRYALGQTADAGLAAQKTKGGRPKRRRR